MTTIAKLIRTLVTTEVKDDASLASLPSKTQIFIWALLTAFVIAVSLSNFQTHQIGSWQDDRIYAILARSIVKSNHYGIMSVPGDEPFPAPFPFGYPLVLAPLVTVFPEDVDILKVPSLVATVVNVAILFWGWPLFSRRSHWWGLTVLSLYVAHPQTIWHTRMVMSEPIFVSFYLATLILVQRAVRGTFSWWHRCLTGLSLTFVLFSRTVGATFVASVFVYLLIVDFRKHWKEMIYIPMIMSVVTGAILVLTPISVTNLVPERYLRERNADLVFSLLGIKPPLYDPQELLPATYVYGQSVNTPESEERVSQKNSFGIFLWTIEQHYARNMRQLVLPIGGGERERALFDDLGIPVISSSIGFVFTLIIMIGVVIWLAQEGLSLAQLSMLFYLAPTLFWAWVGPRYFYPIQAQLFFALFIGAEALWQLVLGKRLQTNTGARLTRVILLLALVCLAAVFGYKSITLEDTRLHTGDFRSRTSWIAANVPASAIIMTNAPLIDFVYGNKKTMPYPTSFLTESDLEEYVRRYNITHVLLAPKIDWYPEYAPEYSEPTESLLNLLQSAASVGKFEMIFSSQRDLIKVYRYRSSAESSRAPMRAMFTM